jgi:release factor glutamine methyltransferase
VPEARCDAELLLADLLATDRGGLFLRGAEPLEPAAAAELERRVRLRESRVPLQHITGVQEFYGLEFVVDRRVLIPRPETEGLIDAALAAGLPAGAAVADLGTGSGCLAITLAVRLPGLRCFALERSVGALEVAAENARRHGVAERVELVEGDLAAPPQEWRGRMSMVLSNPPYVAEGDWERLQPEVRDHDPREALVAGPTGLDALTALMPAARRLLRPGGWLIAEIGQGQAAAVAALAGESGFSGVELREDFQSIPRVLVARAGESDR